MAVQKKNGKNNKERILEAAVALMNEQGGAVGTAQIATHLDISPGNLYYHFRNREEIIRELFDRMSVELLEFLKIEPAEDVPPVRLASCFSGGARILSRYRFLFAVDFIAKDEALAESYRDTSRRAKAYMKIIIKNALRHEKKQRVASDADCARLAENMWVLWISWPRYTELDPGGGVIRESDIWRGLEQIAFLLAPYLDKDYYAKTIRQLRRARTPE
jgi:AcrR family transcriptional regulator